jgi:hypothetical protein
MKNQSNRQRHLIALLFLAVTTGPLSAAEYAFRISQPGIKASIATPTEPTRSSATLYAPYSALVYEGKHPAWVVTGHDWAWHSSNYTVSADVGSYRFQALLSNDTSASRAIILSFSADNTLESISLNGSPQPVPACYTNGFGGLCNAALVLVPGQSLITISINNAGSAANPAGFSAWVTDRDSGAILADTTVTPNVSSWYKF